MRYLRGKHCLGRTGADFVYYDPWSSRRLDRRQYQSMITRGRPQLPVGHPVGFDFDIEVPGWGGGVYTPSEGGGGPSVDGVPVDYLTEEHERGAQPGRFLDHVPNGGYSPVNMVGGTHSVYSDYYRASFETVAYAGSASHRGGAEGDDGMVESSPTAGQSLPVGAVDVVRQFLLEVGISERSCSGTYDEMVSYLRGRLGL